VRTLSNLELPSNREGDDMVADERATVCGGCAGLSLASMKSRVWIAMPATYALRRFDDFLLR
jgi:hypothetical protein